MVEFLFDISHDTFNITIFNVVSAIKNLPVFSLSCTNLREQKINFSNEAFSAVSR
jgi:hypothetical protein